MNVSAETCDRFWSRVALGAASDCWEWQAATRSGGYGTICINGKQMAAHRAALLIVNGEEPPKGSFVCHRCDNPSCVNPAHLYVGDHASNMRDVAERRRHRYHGASTCSRGHPLDGAQGGKYRVCLTCKRARDGARGDEYRARFNQYRRDQRKRIRTEGGGE